MNKSNNGNNSFKNFINKIPSLLTRKGSNSGNEGNLTPTNTKEDLGELGNKDFKHNNSFELYKKKKNKSVILEKEKNIEKREILVNEKKSEGEDEPHLKLEVQQCGKILLQWKNDTST